MYDEMLDEVEGLATTMSHAQLALLLEERGHALGRGEPGRAAWLAMAGESWELDGDLVRAKTCFEEAVEDGGGAYIDPRAELVGLLLDLGETERADELVDEIRRDAEAGTAGGLVHATVGEALELHGRLEDALAWFASGLTASEKESGEADVVCLNGRFRVRRALGLPLDGYDDLAEERRQGYAAELSDERSLLEGPGSEATALMTVLFWSPEGFALLMDRWPELASEYGSDHTEHRALVEGHLAALREHGGRLAVGAADFTEFLLFAEARGEQAMDAATRAAYAAHVGHVGRVMAWPPGDQDPCWCGSGRDYADCCSKLVAG